MRRETGWVQPWKNGSGRLWEGGAVGTAWPDCLVALPRREWVGWERRRAEGPMRCPVRRTWAKGMKMRKRQQVLRILQCPNLRIPVYTQVACLSSAALRKALYEWKWKSRSSQWGSSLSLGLCQCLSSLCKATQVWGDKSVRGTEWRTCPRLELGDVVLPTALLWTQMDVPEWVINTPGLCPDSDMKWIRPPPRPFPTLKTLSFWGAKVQLLLVIRCDWLSEKTVCSSDSVTDFSLLF